MTTAEGRGRPRTTPTLLRSALVYLRNSAMMQDVSEAAQISDKFNQEKWNYVMTFIEWKCVSVSDYTAWRLTLHA